VIDPFNCGSLGSKNKRGKLQGYWATSLDYDGIAYRIIYRIYDKPAPRRVEVIAFGEHDSAYEKAQERSL
jgi:mRNA interferase RelE/StbE